MGFVSAVNANQSATGGATESFFPPFGGRDPSHRRRNLGPSVLTWTGYAPRLRTGSPTAIASVVDRDGWLTVRMPDGDPLRIVHHRDIMDHRLTLPRRKPPPVVRARTIVMPNNPAMAPPIKIVV